MIWPSAARAASGAGITASSLQINTSGYSITGNTLTLAGGNGTIFIPSGATATIGSTIAGSTGLRLNGGGTVNLSTGRNTRKALAIAAAGRFSLCVQDERPPYKYVTVEGPAVMAEVTDAERLELARRYLGIEGGDAYIAANPGGSQVMIRMTPEHWLSRAYSDG